MTSSLNSKQEAVDIFTFIERKWCCPIANPPSTWVKTDDNIGLLEIKDYETWWSAIGKKTRNMVRKAEKDGVKVSVVPQSDKLAEGIFKIYNETPIRQGRAFPHYGESLELVPPTCMREKLHLHRRIHPRRTRRLHPNTPRRQHSHTLKHTVDAEALG